MQFLVEILKLVEASVRSDRKKAVAYANQLADKLDQAGEVKAAERVRRAVVASSSSVSPAGLALQERLPVDTESRLSLANEEMVRPEDVRLFLESQAQEVVSEFIRYVRAADRLIAEGVGVSPSLLMFGPPGCGKTELARHIAAELGLPLITARTDTLISSFLGSTSKNLRLLFDHTAGRPCVLFLDEFDAIAKLRDDRHEMGELKRVVVSLLQNIDAVAGHTVMLAATNHEHLLDPAIWRRFAYRIQVPLPSADVRRSMFDAFLLHGVHAKTLERLVIASEGLSGSDIKDICEGTRRAAVLDNAKEVKEGDLFRRIILRSLNGENLGVHELIALAKEKHADVYTHQVLADAFGMSKGNVTHILQKRERQDSRQ